MLDYVDVGLVVVAGVALPHRAVERVQHVKDHMAPVGVDDVTLQRTYTI